MSVRKQLEAMDEEHLQCRYGAHRFVWLGFYRFSYQNKRWIASEFAPCPGCGLERIFLLDNTYEVQKRLYRYPGGYLLEYDEGDFRLLKSDYARQLANRHGVSANRELMLRRKNGKGD